MILTISYAPRPTVFPDGWKFRESWDQDPMSGCLVGRVTLSYFSCGTAEGGNVFINSRIDDRRDAISGAVLLKVNIRSDFCYAGLCFITETHRGQLEVSDTEMEVRLANLLRTLPGPYGEGWRKILGPVQVFGEPVVLNR